MFKVARYGGKWKYGFVTLDAAVKYASRIFERRGIVVAVEAYRPRRKGGSNGIR